MENKKLICVEIIFYVPVLCANNDGKDEIAKVALNSLAQDLGQCHPSELDPQIDIFDYEDIVDVREAYVDSYPAHTKACKENYRTCRELL